ncbi:MAG: tetratricopeptide repeat protein [Hyphomicrobiaceae bacterium]
MNYRMLFGNVATFVLCALVTSRVAAGDVEICEGQDLPGRIAACTRLIESGTGLKKGLSRAHNNRGMGFVILRQVDRAINDFDKAIQLDPNFEMPYFNRGYAHVFEMRFDRAEVDFESAMKVKPNWEAPYIGRAVVHFMRGSSDAAIADLTSAISINPSSAEAYVNRGVVYRTKGRIAEAISDFKMTLKIDPFHEGAQRQMRELSIDPGPVLQHPSVPGSHTNYGVEISKLTGARSHSYALPNRYLQFRQ